MTYFNVSLIVLVLLAVLFAAQSDLRTYKIPNWISLVIILAFPVFVLTSPHQIDWIGSVLTALAMLVVGFGLFAFRILGAGDVKLLAALGLWAGAEVVLLFLFAVAVAGGLLVACMFVYSMLRNRGKGGSYVISFQETLKQKVPVPYGVAIALGSITIFYQHAMHSGLIG